MSRALVLAAALALAGAAQAQTAGDQSGGRPADGSPILMQPLSALKPQDNTGTPPAPGATPGVTTDGTGTGIGAPPDATTQAPLPAPVVPGQTTTTTTTVQVAEAPGGVVRWLDKISGDTKDLALKRGQSETEGRLTVTLKSCRYPVDDPASNAYAYLVIRDSLVADPIFQGWMIASSPALNPLDSARYDVWVLHCTTS